MGKVEKAIYLVKQTGDIIEHCGEILVDYHKGQYESEFRVLKGAFYPNGTVVYEDDLSNNKHTLADLPDDLDVEKSNPDTLRVLYGR